MTDPHILAPVGMLNEETGKLLEAQIRGCLESCGAALLLDCSQINFMDSSGFGHLVVSLKLVRQSGRDLVLCALNSQLRLVLQLTGTDQVFRIYATRADFLSDQESYASRSGIQDSSVVT